MPRKNEHNVSKFRFRKSSFFGAHNEMFGWQKHAKCGLKRHFVSSFNKETEKCAECPLSTNLNVNYLKTGNNMFPLTYESDDKYLVKGEAQTKTDLTVHKGYYFPFTIVLDGNCYTAQGIITEWRFSREICQWTFQAESVDFICNFSSV